MKGFLKKEKEKIQMSHAIFFATLVSMTRLSDFSKKAHPDS